MPSILCPHWIPVHFSDSDAVLWSRWNPPFVKVVAVDERPPYLNEIPLSAEIVLRSHPMSEGYGNRSFLDAADAHAQAERDVNACLQMATFAAAEFKIPRERLLFEGRNEPMVWSTEPPELTAAYYARFLVRLHDQGLRGVALNLGIGWPGNDGKDRPPMWAPFEPVIAAMRPGDYIGLHEYWAANGPEENWRWWAGRFTQCPYDVPIIVTEMGVDFGVVGLGGSGWNSQHMPGNSSDERAVRYADQLARYEALARPDGRVRGAFIFTHDGQEQDWWSFDCRHFSLIQPLLKQADQWRAVPLPPGRKTSPPPTPPGPTPTDPPGPTDPPSADLEALRNAAWNQLYRDGVAYNPEAAFGRYARTQKLGAPNTNEFDLGGWRAQGFAQGIVYAAIGKWADLHVLLW